VKGFINGESMMHLFYLLIAVSSLTLSLESMQKSRKTPNIRVGLEVVIDKINLPTVIKTERFPGDGHERVVVTTQPGEIFSIKNGKAEKFLDLSYSTRGDVVKLGNIPGFKDTTYDERGLLGLEFHPHFYKNGRFFLYYSTLDQADKLPEPQHANCCKPETIRVRWENEQRFSHVNVVEEWHYKDAKNVQRVRRLLSIKHPFFNHNSINNLHWSTDLKKLVLATGDGGFRDGPFNLSQDDRYFHGKVIAIDVDAAAWKDYTSTPVARFEELPSSINGLLRVLIKGVRNWSGLTEARNGTKFVGQPGQDAVEAVFAFKTWPHAQEKPFNFGWRGWEGSWPTLQNIDCKTGELTMKASSCVRATYYHDAVALSAVRQQPYCEYYHVDTRPGKARAVCITGQEVYQGSELKGLNNHLIISDWAQTVGMAFPVGQPTGAGFLLHVPIDSRLTELHDYHLLELAHTFTKPAYFVSLGANKNNSQIFLGVYQTAGTTTPYLGTVYRLVSTK